jgi:cytosine/adenosine deaminase-related metal-dependent hydrolase
MTKPNISRRELLAGAGAGAAALLLDPRGLEAQPPSGRTVVFTHTTVVNVDAVQDDVAVAVEDGRIAGIGSTDQILQTYPRAEVYDGRGRALFPGLVNCHAHMAAVLARGFNEDFGFPNSARLAVQPASLLQGEENTLMVTVAALEAIRTGTTTIVENSGGIGRSAPPPRWRSQVCAACSPSPFATAKTLPARCPRKVSAEVKRPGSHPDCETKA